MSEINYEIVKLVKTQLKGKAWTFGQIANVSDTVDDIAEKIRPNIPTKDKLKLIWNVEVFAEELTPFGRIYSRVLNATLREQVAQIIKTELLSAEVLFNEVEGHEISEGSLGGKSSKERKTDEEKPSDEQE